MNQVLMDIFLEKEQKIWELESAIIIQNHDKNFETRFYNKTWTIDSTKDMNFLFCQNCWKRQ